MPAEKLREQLHTSRLFFIASIIVAVLVLVAHINKPLLFPGRSLPIEQAGAVTVSDQGIVVVDRQFHRLLITDPQWKLRRVVDLGLGENPLDKAYSVWLQDDRLYVSGAKLVDDGIFFKSELIAEYTLDGRFVRELYRKNYGTNERHSTQSIFDLRLMDKALVFSEVSGGIFSTKLLSPDGTIFSAAFHDVGEPLQFVLWDDKSGRSIIFSATGRFYQYNPRNEALELLGFVNGQNLLLEYYGLRESERDMLFGNGIMPNSRKLSRGTDNVSGEEFLLFINTGLNVERYSYMDRSSREISRLEYAPELLLDVCAFWAAVAYLLFLLLWGVIRFCHKYHPRPQAGALLVLLAALMAGYYTNYSSNLVRESYVETARLQTEQLHYIMNTYHRDILDGLRSLGPVALSMRPPTGSAYRTCSPSSIT